jgi:hypothetical protein
MANNLNEDKFIVQKDVVQFSDENISAGTIVTILPESVTTTLSNQGNNTSALGNASIVGTKQTNEQNAGSTTRAKSLGAPAQAGTVANTQKLPNIFFNFREKTFPNTQNLLFKFETSKLGGSDFTGAKLSIWEANQTISPNISLTNTNSPFPLSVVKAYDKYFYQLDRGKAISNTITLPIKTNPCYTVLVYAVGRASGTTDIIHQANAVHSFYDSTNQTQTQNCNIGAITFLLKDLQGRTKSKSFNPTASFIGNTLNSQYYSENLTDARTDYDTFINIRYGNFFNPNLSDTAADEFVSFKKLTKSLPQNYNNIPFANISSFKNNISNPTTPVPFVLNTIPNPAPPATVLSTNLDTFSLYFVEMFSGITDVDKDNNILTLQTFVNGMLTYDGSMKLKKTAPINSFGTFKISLSNIFQGSNFTADPDIKLFLFDYLHGVSDSSFSQMKLETRNITESLVYDYRNIILKSTSDIQLSSNSANTSLGFSSALVHPFLNMFFTKKS